MKINFKFARPVHRTVQKAYKKMGLDIEGTKIAKTYTTDFLPKEPYPVQEILEQLNQKYFLKLNIFEACDLKEVWID